MNEDASVDVTQRHIDAGIPGNLFRDPISLAIQEALKCKWAMTGWGYATVGYYDGSKRQYTVEPEKDVESFLRRFDGRLKVGPTTVRLLLDRETPARAPVSATYVRRRYKPATGEITGGTK